MKPTTCSRLPVEQDPLGAEPVDQRAEQRTGRQRDQCGVRDGGADLDQAQRRDGQEVEHRDRHADAAAHRVHRDGRDEPPVRTDRREPEPAEHTPIVRARPCWREPDYRRRPGAAQGCPRCAGAPASLASEHEPADDDRRRAAPVRRSGDARGGRGPSPRARAGRGAGGGPRDLASTPRTGTSCAATPHGPARPPACGRAKAAQCIRGSDFAGVVRAVGPEVTSWQPGDEVYGELGLAGGGWARVRRRAC